MSAGTGVTHSEFNGSKRGAGALPPDLDPAREARHHAGYEQKTFAPDEKRGPPAARGLARRGDGGFVVSHESLASGAYFLAGSAGAAGAGAGVGAGAGLFLVDFKILNSTRRFFCRPRPVLLSAMGASGP
jgi:hypothetical protein